VWDVKETLQEIVGWGYPLAGIILIILAATRNKFPGKPWLVAYLSVELASMLAWRIPRLLLKFDGLDFDMSRFYEVWALPLNIIGLAGFCLLVPLLFALANQPHHRRADDAGASAQHEALPAGDTTSPLYGVHGWLRLFVVANLYIAPVLFGIQQIMGFIGFGMLAEDYPGIVVVGMIEAAVGIFLVVKWIMIARRLQAIAPGVVQEAKRWMLVSLAWNVLSTPLVFMSGIDADEVMPGVMRQLFGGIVAFAIWYSYFYVSKRVKATYPDWNQ
jgi:hypothetical protein